MFRRRDRISLQQRKRLNKKRQRRGILFLVLEFLILAVLVLAAFMMYKLDHLNHNTLDESSLELHETPKGYTNVALFGLDSRDGELSGGVRSDSIMIVSINNKTGDVKIISVYRDTLLKQQDVLMRKQMRRIPLEVRRRQWQCSTGTWIWILQNMLL